MNKTLKVTRYQIHDNVKAIPIYYSVLIMLVAFLEIIAWKFGSPDQRINLRGNGLDSSTAIFIFVVGLNCFKTSFKFISANGVSRKRFFRENILALLGIAALLAVTETILTMVVYKPLINYQQSYEELYQSASLIGSALWLFFLYWGSAMLGWFISLLYYRSNKPLKLVISISPVVIFIGLGFIDSMMDGRVYPAIRRFVLNFWGLPTMNPYSAILNLSLFTALLGSLIFLLIRRAPLKE